MFQWATRSSSPESEAGCGAIEMKGSEAQPKSPRRQWKGIWPAWEQPKLSQSSPPGPSSTKLLGKANTSRSHRNNCEPSMLRASALQEATLPMSMTQVPEGSLQSAGAVITPLQDGNLASEDEDFFEVKMVIKVPKPAKVANDTEQQNLVEELRLELERTQLECQKAMRALENRSKECEDLVALVRELTESRSRLTAFKAVQTERLEDLQQEYLRTLRVAELSRAISKENLTKTAETVRKLNQVEEELSRQRLVTQQTKDRLARQKLDNLDMKERLNMLERLDLLAFRRDSACLVKFQQLNLKETY